MDDGSNGYDRLWAAIDTIKPDLVVLDTFRRFGTGDENSSASSNGIYQKLQLIMANGGPSFVVLHHTRKGTKDNESSEPQDVVKGSNDIVAGMGAVFILTRVSGDNCGYLLTQVKNRYGILSDKQISLRIEGTAPGPVRVTSGGYVEREVSQVSGLALEIKTWLIANKLLQFKTALVNTQFIDARHTKRAVSCAIQIMLQRNFIKRISRGQYELVPPRIGEVTNKIYHDERCK